MSAVAVPEDAILPVPYWRLSGFYFFYYAMVGAVTPYFARWLEGLGQGAMAISVILASWYATRIVAPPVWGHLTQRIGHGLGLLRVGASAACIAFCAFLITDSFLGLLLAMLAYSFFFNAILPQYEAVTLHALGARRTEYGRVRAWGSFGFIVVVLLFGWILERHGQLLPALSVPLLLGIVGCTLWLRPGQAGGAAPPLQPVSIRTVLALPGVTPFLLCALLMQMSFGAYYLFYTLHLERNGLGTGVIGALWALGVVAEIALFFFVPQVLRRLSATALLAISLGLSVLRWLLIAAFPGSLLVLLPMQLLHAASFGAFHAASMQRVSELLPPSARLAGQSLLYSVGSGIGGVSGALLAGVAWKYSGGTLAFVVAALAALAGTALAVVEHRRWRLTRTLSQTPLDHSATG